VVVTDQRGGNGPVILRGDLDRIGLDHDIADGDDVPALVDHDTGALAARTQGGVAPGVGNGLHPDPHHGAKHLLRFSFDLRFGLLGFPGVVLRLLGNRASQPQQKYCRHRENSIFDHCRSL